MSFTDFIVVGIMCGSDFHNARTEFTIDIFIRNNRDFSPDYGDKRCFADIFLIPFIFRVNGDSGIAEDCFRTSRCHRQIISTSVRQHVFEIIECSGFFGIFDFQIGNGGLKLRRPIHDSRSTIHQSVFVKTNKDFAYSLRKAFIQGKSFTVPITGGTETTYLGYDSIMIFLFPLPYFFDKFFSSQIFPINSLRI